MGHCSTPNWSVFKNCGVYDYLLTLTQIIAHLLNWHVGI